MMNFFIKNTYLVGLAQVAMVMAGVVVAIACKQSFGSLDTPPWITNIADDSPLAMLVPLAWVMVASVVQLLPNRSARFNVIASYSGIFVLLFLVVTIGMIMVLTHFGVGEDTSNSSD
jgi:hypothetical protein